MGSAQNNLRITGIPGVHKLLLHLHQGLCQNCGDTPRKTLSPERCWEKGSKVQIFWGPDEKLASEKVKNILLSQLALQTVNPNKPFVLRVDASTHAVGATLEQFIDETRMPTPEDVRSHKTVPVPFLSRKVTPSQRSWSHVSLKLM